MNSVSPKTIALLAFQVSILLGLATGVAALLLPCMGSLGVLALAFATLAGYALLVGYVGLSCLYLLLHWRELDRKQAIWACVAVALFTLLWGGVFESGPNARMQETRAILSTFKSDKGLVARIGIANAVRDTFKHAQSAKIRRDICKNATDYLGHVPVLKDEDYPTDKIIRQLEANYRSVTCY